jgi:hypothetical protein
MSIRLKFSRRIASTLLLSLATAGFAAAQTAISPDLSQRIESARTRSDHEALAAHFSREASASRANAGEHRKMASDFLKYQALAAAKWPDYTMPAHCDSIVRHQEAKAAEFDGRAATHRQLAAQARS